MFLHVFAKCPGAHTRLVQRVIVGINKFALDAMPQFKPIFEVPRPASERAQSSAFSRTHILQDCESFLRFSGTIIPEFNKPSRYLADGQ
jgi:hypothetical protein